MSLDISEIQAESSRLVTQTQGNNSFLDNFVKFPDGNGVVVIRLLGPAKVGMFDREKNPFYQFTRTHRVNGKSVHCPKTLRNKKFEGDCPICNYYSWLWKESEKKDPEAAKALQDQARAIKPLERYYYNCIVRKEIDENGNIHENVGPKILSVGKTLHSMIINAIVGNEELQEPALGDVTDIKNGRDFKIMKTMRQSGKDSYPNYDTSKFLESSPLGDPDQVKVWLETLHDLVSLRTLRPIDELKVELKKHLGVLPQENDTDFNPSEYQQGSDEPLAKVVVRQETPKAKSDVEQFVSESNSGDDSMVDDEFFNQLRNM